MVINYFVSFHFNWSIIFSFLKSFVKIILIVKGMSLRQMITICVFRRTSVFIFFFTWSEADCYQKYIASHLNSREDRDSGESWHGTDYSVICRVSMGESHQEPGWRKEGLCVSTQVVKATGQGPRPRDLAGPFGGPSLADRSQPSH